MYYFRRRVPINEHYATETELTAEVTAQTNKIGMESANLPVGDINGIPKETLTIAVIVPCYNEAATVRAVVSDFQTALPQADIYVYDNNSTDETYAYAKEAGALVRQETRQGKGFVVQRAFADIDADIYVMVDGDNTYDATAVCSMIHLLLLGPYDFVNGARIHSNSEAYRPGHVLGNKILTKAVSAVFGSQTKDMLSGFKVFSRRFVKSFPSQSRGFEIETELMVHALEMTIPIAEMDIEYRERPEDSVSKLNTFRDGFKILRTIIQLWRFEKPLWFFSIISFAFGLISLILFAPVLFTFFETGRVDRFPTAFLSGLLGVCGLLSFSCGLILDLVQRARHEAKKLHYLSLKQFGKFSD